jgi:hypothetical protein
MNFLKGGKEEEKKKEEEAKLAEGAASASP